MKKTQEETRSPSSLPRREFLGKSVGATVFGAAVIAGADKASAQDAGKSGKFSTPDWKSLKPGVHDSDQYTEETGFDVAECGESVGDVMIFHCG